MFLNRCSNYPNLTSCNGLVLVEEEGHGVDAVEVEEEEVEVELV